MQQGSVINTTVLLGKLIEHNTSTGAYKKYYLFNGKLLALREGLSSGSTYRYLVTDHLGSLNTTLNLDGTVYSDLRYTPFGKQRWAINTSPTGARFTAQRLDDLLALYNYNARYYDPAIGRFISADSIVPDSTNPQTFNRLSYTQNNPLNRTDPTGHRDSEADVNENSSDYGLDSDWLEDFLNYVPQNKSTHIPVDTVGDIIIESVNAPSGFLPPSINKIVSKVFGGLSAITDLVEVIAAGFAIVGAKGLPEAMAFLDILFSGASSYAGGETGWITLPGMPEMFVIGQDLAFTMGEAGLAIFLKLFLAGIRTVVAPGAGTFAGSSAGDAIDMVTSLVSFIYDTARVVGTMPTTRGFGIYTNSDGQLTVAVITYNP